MNLRPCNARNPQGVERCIEAFRHDKGPKPTKHSDGEGTTWGVEWAETPTARARVRDKSVKQDARDNGWLRAICYVRLVLQAQAEDFDGTYRCESCGEAFSYDLLVAVQRAQPCHVIPRHEGAGVVFYASGEVRSFGLDTFENIYAGCGDCNLSDHLEDRTVVQLGERAS